jgi:hypothetical protein
MATRDSSAPSAHRPADYNRLTERLRRLEERYSHELLSDEERQELRDRVVAFRRRLGY